MSKCVICDRRPARTAKGYCTTCEERLKAQEKNRENGKPARFLTYRGIVVGLYPNGNKKLEARLLRRSAEGLPKDRTLNLNTYLPGFDRKQIKAFKACCLQLAHA